MRLTRSSFLRRSALIAFAAALSAGCTDFSSPPDQLGRLTVTVKDENNAGVGLINVDLFRGDIPWAALATSADGSGEFRASDGGLIPDAYTVKIALTGNYTLAAGETTDKPVTVVVGQTQTVNYKIVKRVIGGPGGA
jgi:hypothetical protein